MEFRLIAQMRLDGPATGGQATEYPLTPRSGGRFVKDVLYQIKVIARSHAAAMAGVKLNHGPDGTVSVNHSTPIANATVSAVPGLLSGDTTGTAAMISEYLHPILTCISNDATPCWVVVQIFEMRKPF